MADIRDDQGGARRVSTLDVLRRLGPPVLLVVVAVLFVAQNTERTTFAFLWFEFAAPLWVTLVAFAVVGAVVASVVGRRRRSRLV